MKPLEKLLPVAADPTLADELRAVTGSLAVNLVIALIILAVTLWLSGLMGRLVKRAFARIHPRGDTDTTLANFLGSLVRYGIVLVGLVAVLAQLGVQTTSILAVLGAASLAIGLALQGTLGNVAAGVMLLILRPYRVGDYVELAGRNGTVLSLDLFVTTLDAVDGLRLTIPNGKIFGEVIVNYTTTGRRRVELVLRIDYEDDVDKAFEAIRACIAADARVLKLPEPWIKVTNLGDHGVDITIRAWVEGDDYPNAGPDLLKALKAALETAGTRFPYPHQVGLTRGEFLGKDEKTQ